MSIYKTNTLPGRTVITAAEEKFLWFSGTDYLGMGHNEAFRTFLKDGLENYGNHFGSSRNNTLQLNVYDEAEGLFAAFTGSPSALIVSSGMWAGQLVMKEIENLVHSRSETERIKYHYAPRVHPALWGNYFKPETASWKNWAYDVVQEINNSTTRTAHVICTDATGSPMVEEFDFSIFNVLPPSQNTWLIVDESHALGITGDDGRGFWKSLDRISGINKIILSSLNKALGIPGGVILSNKLTINQLRRSPWFAGASPPAPAYMHALKMMLNTLLYAKLHSDLIQNIRYFEQKLSAGKLFESIHNYPVFCSKNLALFDHLLENKIMASCFSYPMPTDAPVTRIVISALHQKEDLDKLAEVCKLFISLG
ncbi:aminotransferase class I/II-fold pyridoxal phosphate-dependent enzyme [Dyadobacter sediminis]|uniref:Pyridoxal phosphate-dependent aminotransferase family protein n=1 Tax=Dyadobacter sediminis TaxID=1493691 RepID=A0A5R9K613_9BACT|nr:aminotransferase class I/II-fold pyridoxal phosphate-dependent enzyme [Dyadobacter sediminis]TLU89101.1 pyridoxal phosphate-dependent aminotransferase family protein [Dyadobacter sediminis]GGC02749.1 8-amino-7-oxononanoate synthase [Dyadobacter sediminis]